MTGRFPTATVAGDLADYLRRLIHSGQLSEGDRLPPERQLAATFGVARVSVREAIRTLQEDGYLAVRRGGGAGTYVAALDRPYATWLRQMRHRTGELDAILDLRIAVEGHAAQLAAERRSNTDLQELRTALELLADASSHTTFRSADNRFHLGVLTAARSPRLEQVALEARGSFFVPTDSLIYTDQINESHKGHAAVLDAIHAREPEAARAAMADHIEDTRAHVHKLLRGQPL
jgi:DNA-binding FadR family transcriptional regulator